MALPYRACAKARQAARPRRTLREARSRKPASDPETKLKAVRKAAGFAFPTADIREMLHEIEQGYES